MGGIPEIPDEAHVYFIWLDLEIMPVESANILANMLKYPQAFFKFCDDYVLGSNTPKIVLLLF